MAIKNQKKLYSYFTKDLPNMEQNEVVITAEKENEIINPAKNLPSENLLKF